MLLCTEAAVAHSHMWESGWQISCEDKFQDHCKTLLPNFCQQEIESEEEERRRRKKEERKKKKKNKLSLMDGDLLKHAAVATDQFFFVAKAIIISCNWRSSCSIRILLSKKFHNYIIKMFTLVSRILQIRIPSSRRRQLLQWLIQAASKQASIEVEAEDF